MMNYNNSNLEFEILSSNDISQNQKRSYLRLLKINKSINKADCKNLEELIFTFNDKTLNDDERINYELSQILLDVDDITLYDNTNYTKEDIKLLAKQIHYDICQSSHKKSTIDENKRKVLDIQTKLGINSNLFSVYSSYIEQDLIETLYNKNKKEYANEKEIKSFK